MVYITVSSCIKHQRVEIERERTSVELRKTCDELVNAHQETLLTMKDLEAENSLRIELEKELQEKNVALKELLNQLEKEKKAIEERLVANSELLLLPMLDKMKDKCSKIDNIYLDMIECTIKNLTSSFGPSLENISHKLTPREIEICNLIKNGVSTKEIAKTLGISKQTVEYHRKSIRKKLQINSRNKNLASYLNSL